MHTHMYKVNKSEKASSYWESNPALVSGNQRELKQLSFSVTAPGLSYQWSDTRLTGNQSQSTVHSTICWRKCVLHRTVFSQKDMAHCRVLMPNLKAAHARYTIGFIHGHNQNRTDGLRTKSVDPLWLYVHHIQLYPVVLTEHWQLNCSCKTNNGITCSKSSKRNACL